VHARAVLMVFMVRDLSSPGDLKCKMRATEYP